MITKPKMTLNAIIPPVTNPALDPTQAKKSTIPTHQQGNDKKPYKYEGANKQTITPRKENSTN
jgi:hypothetical protein